MNWGFGTKKVGLGRILALGLALTLTCFLAQSLPRCEARSESGGKDGKENCPEECICKIRNVGQGKGEFGVNLVTCVGRNLSRVPDGLPLNVEKLDLEQNGIEEVGDGLLSGLRSLAELSLARNKLERLSTELMGPGLKILDLAYNKIKRLEDGMVVGGSKLEALLLGNNKIESIGEEAFRGLENLYILELHGNKLESVPRGVIKLRNLREINLANNRITRIEVPFHHLLPRIVDIELKGNPIGWSHPEAFAHLRHLKKLIFSDVKNLKEFPDLNGTNALEILRIDRCSLNGIPENLCSITPKLKSLDLKSNKIRELPRLLGCSDLRILDVGLNEIEELEDASFGELRQLHDLHLSGNRIKRISAGALDGLVALRALDLSHNLIEDIEADAFLSAKALEDLNLGNNYFKSFPSKGLTSLVHLKVANNPNLREFPGPESYPRVRTLVLSFAYHCCQYSAYGMARSFSFEPKVDDTIIYPTDNDFGAGWTNANFGTDVWPGFANFSSTAEFDPTKFWETYGSPLSTGASVVDDDASSREKTGMIPHRDIQCIPLPGPFLPCTDLFDWWTLRCGVWVVFLLALMGNGTVVFVLIFARTKMDVPRFLVCNLAIADFCMGVYLGFLAVVDAATLGEFRRFAISWQFSKGCQMAGFLGVLSSELSVYTLAVITMERHYAITHAMHLNKRLSLRHAGYIMLIGWCFALIMAILPLMGISDYRKFAVCLPFETGDGLSMSYVVFLMFANGVAFTILMGCYLKMYCSIRGSQAWNSNDTRIAKRMALLVFTDLLCWFPIAFFSLTAVFGLHLISLEEAKVFTVFILPLNSCCNPFLYAILTKQFKKDCVLICKAIEESRVTRGIGRCRHSSNFSNRQTAPNTGSLVEKSSKDGQPCICHSGLHPVSGDENGNGKYRFIPPSERWDKYGRLGRFFSRYILCQNNSKEAARKARDDYRMRNVRRFLYTSTPGNYPPETQKHHRHPSVSSDNFSSSRSDSWRGQGKCGIPLRLLEPRRRNSWAVTRKPSQDSNLSSSRNDSSATSASTATWRLSRSSVSSDAASHSGGGKSSLKKTLAAAAASTHNYGNISRAVIASNLNSSANIANVAHLGKSCVKGPGEIPGIHHPALVNPQVGALVQSEALLIDLSNKNVPSVKPTSGILHHMQAQQHPPQEKHVKLDVGKTGKKKHVTVEKVVEEGKDFICDDELSAKIATNRPRLVRQSAFFSDEVVIEPEVCPVHGLLIPGTYDNEEEEDGVSDIEEGNEDEKGEEEDDGTSPILRKGHSQNPYGIALVIVPRRARNYDGSGIDHGDGGQTVVKFAGIGPSSICQAGSMPVSPNSASARSSSKLLDQAAWDPNARKLSEQPMKLYTGSASTGVADSPKWKSMSNMDVVQGETIPQLHQTVVVSGKPAEVTALETVDETGGGKSDTCDQSEMRRVSFLLPPKTQPVDVSCEIPSDDLSDRNKPSTNPV